jgi:hypothetical protein
VRKLSYVREKDGLTKLVMEFDFDENNQQERM